MPYNSQSVKKPVSVSIRCNFCILNLLSYFHVHVASPSFTTNDTVNGTIDSGRVQYINYPFDITNGTTIQVHVTFGEVVIYISTIISNPNEAFYDVVIEGGGYIDVYLSPATLCITTQTVYIAIVGSAGGNINSSEVSISAAIGDISTGMCRHSAFYKLLYTYYF